jgi:hypothetical protein
VKTEMKMFLAVACLLATALSGCASKREPEMIDVADRIAQARAAHQNPAVSAGPGATGYSSRRAYIK